ncbi:MAG: hypothetical protein NC924_03105 [Candidatus Omnitrophica bacterium]|nr:hypothetical protein [Candidatus Omnitrophota bacterium]
MRTELPFSDANPKYAPSSPVEGYRKILAMMDKGDIFTEKDRKFVIIYGAYLSEYAVDNFHLLELKDFFAVMPVDYEQKIRAVQSAGKVFDEQIERNPADYAGAVKLARERLVYSLGLA